jgi:hypothetical protein
VELALAVARLEGLGRDEIPDLLWIHIGCPWGEALSAPTDPGELERGKLAIGAALGRVLEYLDTLEGGTQGTRAPWILAVAATHGLASSFPGREEKESETPCVLALETLARAVDLHLDRTVRPLDWVLGSNEAGLWLNPKALRTARLSARDAQALARESLRLAPGVEACFGREATLCSTGSAGEETLAALRSSTHPERFPDLFVLPGTFTRLVAPGPRRCGSPRTADSRVPLLLCGSGIPTGRITRRIGLRSFTSTLALLLSIEPPSHASGELLDEALRR